MLAYGWLVGIAVLGASIATAALLLWIVSRMGSAPGGSRQREAREGERACVMLFDGATLHDATPPARALIDAIEGGGDARARLLRHLGARFGPLGDALDDLEALGRVEFRADGARLSARWCEGLARIELVEAADAAASEDGRGGARGAVEGSGVAGDAPLGAIEGELRMLRAAVESSPWPIWHTGPDGAVDWANPAYVERAAPPDASAPPGWPPPALFEGQGGERDGARERSPFGVTAALGALGAVSRSGPRLGDRRRADATGGLRPGGPARRLRALPSTRAAAQPEGGRTADVLDDPGAWYDCVARPGVVPGAAMHFAAPAAGAVRAERSMEQFAQTLSKTFAHLPVGLAVFDAKRGLSLFNPALTDLTRLPIDFLSARPTLPAFLDRLREARRMPEPRDYRSWRERITALEEASAEGTYLETWSLSGGQTWRVSGRPHPDGAIALMFEDITSEIALTRRFRSELEIGQAVVDAMREAIAVFAPDGVLTLANEAYARLWGSDPRTSLGDMSVVDASRGWMEASEPEPLWGELRDFVGQIGERAPWTGEARLKDGRKLTCRAVPLSAGSTLIGFAAEPVAEPVAEPMAEPSGADSGGATDGAEAVDQDVERGGEPAPSAEPAAGFTPRLIKA